MKITFLGTGTSQGVPVIACPCPVCASPNPKDKRLRTSILVETEKTTIVIDTGPDFRYQMLRQNVKKVDAVLFTHGHKDHTAGLDDIRAFNYFQRKAMDVYATPETRDGLKKEFAYIFENGDYPGIPRLQLHDIDPEKPFAIQELTIIPVRVLHYRMEVIGFRINNFTYITDANYISTKERRKIKGSKVMIINALRKEKHISHFSLSEALVVAKDVGAEEVYFTHISHQMGLHDQINGELPENVHLAYDGLTLKL